jgi:hypothetical protein
MDSNQDVVFAISEDVSLTWPQSFRHLHLRGSWPRLSQEVANKTALSPPGVLEQLCKINLGLRRSWSSWSRLEVK